jgi:DUF4097 and DUF4098 domain-containing protein YvlB
MEETMVKMSMMRRALVFLSASTLVFGAIIAAGSNVFAAEGHFERTLQVTGPVELNVGTGSGTIHVRTGDSNTVRVVGEIKASEGFLSGDDADKKVKMIEANPPIEQHGNTIEIGRFRDEDLQHNVSISYELTVPAQTRLKSGSGSGSEDIAGIAGPLEASSGSGSLTISNIGDTVRASTGSGSIDLSGVKGNVRATTGSGEIHATGIAGGFRASTGSGPVTLEQTAPGYVEVSTGSGRVALRNVHGSVRAHTASGNIVAEGEGSGAWHFGTASGSVDVRLPASEGFDLHAETVSGRIITDRQMTVQGEIGRRSLSGRVGNGGFTLEVSTVSGNIHVE